MAFTIVLNGEEEASHNSLKNATKQFELLKTKPDTDWITIVRSSRKLTEVIVYYDNSITTNHNKP